MAMKPMLAEVADRSLAPDVLLSLPGWSYELKLDGVRILSEIKDKTARLWYRSGREATHIYPEIAEALSFAPDGTVLDGEVIALDPQGAPSFGLLQRRMHLSRAQDVRRAKVEVPVVYVVFDMPRCAGVDFRSEPLSVRRKQMVEVVPDTGIVRTFEPHDDGRGLFALCKERGFEGVIAKRLDSTYQAGVRSLDWLKIKAERSDEFVVIGYTRGESGARGLGALDLATYEDGKLVVRGKVGSGFDANTLALLHKKLKSLEQPTCAATGDLGPAPGGRVFVAPKLVVSVRFASWSHENRLRMPVFRGIREDVAPADCTARPEAWTTDAPPTR